MILGISLTPATIAITPIPTGTKTARSAAMLVDSSVNIELSNTYDAGMSALGGAPPITIKNTLLAQAGYRNLLTVAEVLSRRRPESISSRSFAVASSLACPFGIFEICSALLLDSKFEP